MSENSVNLNVSSHDLNIDAPTVSNYAAIYNLVTSNLSDELKGTFSRSYDNYEVTAISFKFSETNAITRTILGSLFEFYSLKVALDFGALERFNRMIRLDARIFLGESHVMKAFIRDATATTMMIQNDDYGFFSFIGPAILRKTAVSIDEGTQVIT